MPRRMPPARSRKLHHWTPRRRQASLSFLSLGAAGGNCRFTRLSAASKFNRICRNPAGPQGRHTAGGPGHLQRRLRRAGCQVGKNVSGTDQGNQGLRGGQTTGFLQLKRSWREGNGGRVLREDVRSLPRQPRPIRRQTVQSWAGAFRFQGPASLEQYEFATDESFYCLNPAAP